MKVYTMKKFVTLLNRRNDLKMALDMGAKFDFNTYMNEDFPVLKKAGTAYRAYWKDCKNDVYCWNIDNFVRDIKIELRKRGQLSERSNEYIDIKAIAREFLNSGKEHYVIKCTNYTESIEETFVLNVVDERHMALNYGLTSYIFDMTNSLRTVNTSVNEFIKQQTGGIFSRVEVNKEYSFHVYAYA